MSKEKIYKQIENFNQKIINEKETKSKKYYYIQNDVAIDKSSFIQYLVNEDISFTNSYDEVLDICYGSANLTAHIVHDGGIRYKNITLNDTNTSDRNNDVDFGTKTDFDFLDASKFDTKYDLIVFNPQIGGTDQGAVNFEFTLKPIVFDGSLEDYLISLRVDTSKLTFTEDSTTNSLLIYSDDLADGVMGEMFKEIKLFNYKDVFYKSKTSTKKGSETKIAKFRETIEKISKENSVIVFFGEPKHYELLFADFTYIRQYLQSNGKQLYILAKYEDSKKCFEKIENEFIENEECVIKKEIVKNDVSFSELLEQMQDINIDEGITGMFSSKKKRNAPSEQDDSNANKTFSSQTKQSTNLDFEYKNILFKGVPGTGKSRAVNKIIINNLGLSKNDENVLRINIHSASSNSDLMQGIGISSDDKGQVRYAEKQGLILDLIKRATFHPKQPFVLVLEEIQENSLNELIGDLIYLIEEDKRAILNADDKNYESYEQLVESVTQNANVDYVQIPFLVSDTTEYRKMIIPSNLYIFCTSNYRDDKKIIEDNLLRRFEVIEIYPKSTVASEYSRDFFKSLNTAIRDVLNDEIHPDRFMIGHTIFQKVQNTNDFDRALLKVVTEFKDIKEIEYDEFKKILSKCDFKEDKESFTKHKGYFELINFLQKKIDYDFLKEDS